MKKGLIWFVIVLSVAFLGYSGYRHVKMCGKMTADLVRYNEDGVSIAHISFIDGPFSYTNYDYAAIKAYSLDLSSGQTRTYNQRVKKYKIDFRGQVELTMIIESCWGHGVCYVRYSDESIEGVAQDESEISDEERAIKKAKKIMQEVEKRATSIIGEPKKCERKEGF